MHFSCINVTCWGALGNLLLEKVYWFLGLLASLFLGFRFFGFLVFGSFISWFRSLWSSKLLGFLGFEIPWFFISKFQSFLVSKFQSFKTLIHVSLKDIGTILPNFHCMCSGRCWPHIQDLQEFIRRIVWIFGPRLFQYFRHFLISPFRDSQNNIFQNGVWVCLNDFRYPCVSKDK